MRILGQGRVGHKLGAAVLVALLGSGCGQRAQDAPAPTDSPLGQPISYVFDRPDTPIPWLPWNQLSSLRLTDRRLIADITGNDPNLVSPELNTSLALVEVRMLVPPAAVKQAEIFWITADDTEWGTRGKVASFPLLPDQMTTYRVKCDAHGTVTRIRLDPGQAPGRLEIEYIKLYPHGS
jgi:hypothetical protein